MVYYSAQNRCWLCAGLRRNIFQAVSPARYYWSFSREARTINTLNKYKKVLSFSPRLQLSLLRFVSCLLFPVFSYSVLLSPSYAIPALPSLPACFFLYLFSTLSSTFPSSILHSVSSILCHSFLSLFLYLLLFLPSFVPSPHLLFFPPHTFPSFPFLSSSSFLLFSVYLPLSLLFLCCYSSSSYFLSLIPLLSLPSLLPHLLPLPSPPSASTHSQRSLPPPASFSPSSILHSLFPVLSSESSATHRRILRHWSLGSCVPYKFVSGGSSAQ